MGVCQCKSGYCFKDGVCEKATPSNEKYTAPRHQDPSGFYANQQMMGIETSRMANRSMAITGLQTEPRRKANLLLMSDLWICVGMLASLVFLGMRLCKGLSYRAGLARPL